MKLRFSNTEISAALYSTAAKATLSFSRAWFHIFTLKMVAKNKVDESSIFKNPTWLKILKIYRQKAFCL